MKKNNIHWTYTLGLSIFVLGLISITALSKVKELTPIGFAFMIIGVIFFIIGINKSKN